MSQSLVLGPGVHLYFFVDEFQQLTELTDALKWGLFIVVHDGDHCVASKTCFTYRVVAAASGNSSHLQGVLQQGRGSGFSG